MMDWADIIAARCIGDGMGDGDTRRLIAEALRAEREACAIAAWGTAIDLTELWVADAVAAAIRARGTT